MFLETSRYHAVPQTEVRLPDGRTVRAVKLRRIPAVSGTPTVVREGDRLDLLAHRVLDDGTRFWRIADANPELEARSLEQPPGRLIDVPES